MEKGRKRKYRVAGYMYVDLCDECKKYVETGVLEGYSTVRHGWINVYGIIVSKEVEYVGRLEESDAVYYEFFRAPNGHIIMIGGFWGDAEDVANVDVACTEVLEDAKKKWEEFKRREEFRRKFYDP